MSKPKLATAQVVEVLIGAANAAAYESNAAHPVDLAYAMTAAIEHAAETIALLRKHGHLDWQQ